MAIERRKIVYRGRVQGVGFRMTARRLASAFPVSGHVRNRPDGSVELVVEGEPGAMASYLARLQAEFEEKITDVEHQVEIPVGASPSGLTILD